MVTLGTDPEFFIADENGRPIPICGLLGGTKGEPLDIGDGFAVQEDNVMVEWNIAPVRTADEFAHAVHIGYQRVVDFVRTKVPNAVPKLEPSMMFPHKALESEQAQQFGCAPDFMAHQRGDPAPIVDPDTLVTKKGGLRYAGGHVHIGYDNPNDVPDFVVAALADVFLGLPSILQGDRQGDRRALYGSPGRYRPTPYGIEYRVLSNYWTSNRNDAAFAIGVGAQNLGLFIETADVANVQTAFKTIPWGDVQRAIVREDMDQAHGLIRYVQRELNLMVGG